MQVRKHEAEKSPRHNTDWQRLRSMTDADIDRAFASDPDAAPSLTREQMKAEYRPAPARIKR